MLAVACWLIRRLIAAKFVATPPCAFKTIFPPTVVALDKETAVTVCPTADLAMVPTGCK